MVEISDWYRVTDFFSFHYSGDGKAKSSMVSETGKLQINTTYDDYEFDEMHLCSSQSNLIVDF